MSKKKGNGFHNYGNAMKAGHVCRACQWGVGPFVIQAMSEVQGGVSVAHFRVCECQESLYYMRLGTEVASCECWRERKASDQPRIMVAHKAVPPLKVTA